MPSFKVNLKAGEPRSLSVTAEEADRIYKAIKGGKVAIVTIEFEYTNDGKASRNVTAVPVDNIASVEFFDVGPRKQTEGVRIG